MNKWITILVVVGVGLAACDDESESTPVEDTAEVTPDVAPEVAPEDVSEVVPLEPCGEVTPTGTCEGEVLLVCSEMDAGLVRRDCALEGLFCAFIDAERGHGCVNACTSCTYQHCGAEKDAYYGKIQLIASYIECRQACEDVSCEAQCESEHTPAQELIGAYEGCLESHCLALCEGEGD